MLNLKKEEREIDGLLFKTQQLPAMRASLLLGRLVKHIGPVLGALSGLDPSTQLSELGSALTLAFAQANPDEATRLIPEILGSTSVIIEGKHVPLNSSSNIDLVFSGRLKTMFMAVGFALQVNYRDFWEGGESAAPPQPAS